MLNPKLLIIGLLFHLNSACGQVSPAYEVVNGTYNELISPVYSNYEFKRYYLLNTSFEFPSKILYNFFTVGRSVIDSIAQYIPKDEVVRMFSDTSFVGTRWKERDLIKAKVVSERRAKKFMSEKALLKYERKLDRQGRGRRSIPDHKTRSYYKNKWLKSCYRCSYPVFDSSKEYALVYFTDYKSKYVGRLYFCHLINGKFDKILFADGWFWQL